MPYFRYIGDCLSSGGGCELATITRCHLALGKFNELLPALTSRSFPITSKGRVYNSLVKSAKAPCKRNLGHNLSWLASPTQQWPSYDSLDVRWKSARRISWRECSLYWRSGNGTPHPPTPIVRPCIHKLAPTYLCKRLTLKPKRGLRSDNKLVLDIPRTKLKLKTYGDRSFSIAGPTLWNKLPRDIRLSESVDIFKQKLKTHFFKQDFY